MDINKYVKQRNAALHANHRKRMKEKFLKYGPDVFSEHEIMEILLYFVLPQVDTNEIAHELINKGGSFMGAFNIPYEEMKKIPGIKDHAATFLKLMPHFFRYFYSQEAQMAASPRMTYEEIAEMCAMSCIGLQEEHLICIYFDAKMIMLEKETISTGSSFNVESNARKILNGISRNDACNIVIAHNHPSSLIMPSSDDIDSTQRLKDILNSFHIDMVEHFIVTGDKYIGVLKFLDNNVKGYKRR
ncbi:MAG: hypothetical protein E7613_01015 [Ruminococcaceae bacterium]|nr:hypothetical protein [Oscillospiraceae bacterium]